MNCPVCGGKTKVINVGRKPKPERRRRECTSCLSRFNTLEVIEWETMDSYLKEKVENHA